MNLAKKHKRAAPSVTENSDAASAAIRDRILLHLARATLLVMLSIIAFLVNDYLRSMHKAMDGMARSIEKIGVGQERISVTMARVDETVRHIERRVERIENKQP